MPDPAAAGSSRIVTGAPEWSPIPANSMGEAIVCSKWTGFATNIILQQYKNKVQ
jgi:hypothetical protein